MRDDRPMVTVHVPPGESLKQLMADLTGLMDPGSLPLRSVSGRRGVLVDADLAYAYLRNRRRGGEQGQQPQVVPDPEPLMPEPVPEPVREPEGAVAVSSSPAADAGTTAEQTGQAEQDVPKRRGRPPRNTGDDVSRPGRRPRRPINPQASPDGVSELSEV